MQCSRIVLALCVLFLISSCSEPVAPGDSDLRFADVVDMKISAQPNQITCLLYVQVYSDCQEPVVASAKQTDSRVELAVTTMQRARSLCDTNVTVKKLWHQFTNVPTGTTMQVHISADKDSRTNRAVDTLVTVTVP